MDKVPALNDQSEVSENQKDVPALNDQNEAPDTNENIHFPALKDEKGVAYKNLKTIDSYDVGLNLIYAIVADGQSKFLHTFVKPGDKDWDEFLQMQPGVIHKKGNKISVQVDDTDSIEWLWGNFIHSVTYPSGLEVLPGDRDWKEKVPYQHRKRAVHQLTSSEPAEEEFGFAFGSPEKTVALMVPQNGFLFQVNHTFRQPTPEDDRIYQKLKMGTQFFTQTKAGLRKVAVIELPGFISLYKSMVIGVEGYSESGSGLSENRNDWVPKIPAPHKKSALDLLFQDDDEVLGN